MTPDEMTPGQEYVATFRGVARRTTEGSPYLHLKRDSPAHVVYIFPGQLAAAVSIEPAPRALPATPGSVVRWTYGDEVGYAMLNEDGEWYTAGGEYIEDTRDLTDEPWELIHDAGATAPAEEPVPTWDTAKVDDKLAAHEDEYAPACHELAPSSDFRCRRIVEHSGQHVATTNPGRVAAVWPAS